jgi:hypothetical protein
MSFTLPSGSTTNCGSILWAQQKKGITTYLAFILRRGAAKAEGSRVGFSLPSMKHVGQGRNQRVHVIL